MSTTEDKPEKLEVAAIDLQPADIKVVGDIATMTLGTEDDFKKSCPVPHAQVKAVFTHMKTFKDRVAEEAATEAGTIFKANKDVKVVRIVTPGFGSGKSDTLKTTVVREKVFPGGTAPNGKEYPETRRPTVSQKVEIRAFASKQHLKDLGNSLKERLK